MRIKNIITIICASLLFTLFFATDIFAAPTDIPSYVTHWGTAGAGESQFNNPLGIAVAGNGNVYVADAGNHRIQIFDEDGNFLSAFGTNGSGNGQFNNPQNIAFDYTNEWIYVVDNGNARIQKFDMEWNHLLNITETADPPGNGSWFNPWGIVVDQENGNVILSLPGEARVDFHDSDGNYLYSASSFLNAPRGMAIVGEELHVVDQSSATVIRFNKNTGVAINTYGTTNGARGVALDYEGYLYVAERNINSIQKFDPISFTQVVPAWGSAGSGAGQFNGPYGIAVDQSGSKFYVTETGNARVQKFVFPAPTESPTIVEIMWDGTSAEIQFEPVSGHDQYQICYTNLTTSVQECEIFTIDDPELLSSYTVESLDPYTSYSFVLYAYTPYANGPASETIELAAQPEPPEETPTEQLPETGSPIQIAILAAIMTLGVQLHILNMSGKRNNKS